MQGHLTSKEYLHGEDLPFQLIRRDPQTEYPLHSHEFSELVIVYRGSGVHILPGGTRPVAAGDVFLIHSGNRHAYSKLKSLALCNLLFDLSAKNNPIPFFSRYSVLRPLFLLELLPGKPCLHLSPDELAEAADMLEHIEKEQASGTPDSVPAMTAWFVLLVLFLGRCAGRAGLTESGAPLMRLINLIDRIAENPARDWSRAVMMREAGMSVCTLTRHFKMRTGCSPTEYVIRTRLDKAARLLMNPDSDIETASDLSGFSDSNYFCRQFRKHYGISPGKFRRKSLNN